MIWFTSDTHFNHNKEFVWKVRGFNSCDEMNEYIVRRWNEVVQPDDEVYHLGDVMLGPENGIHYLERLAGHIHIIAGNHDTDKRIEMYKNCWNVEDIQWALRKKLGGYHFYMSHFPTITSNLEKETLRQCTLNLFGHTHQKTNFYLEYPFMYHVGMDSHGCELVSLEQIIYDMEKKVKECKDLL